MSQSAGDRNLLFGILALQMDFINREQLVAAMQVWVLDKQKPLGQILLDAKALEPSRHALLDALVQEHLKQHDNDPHQSLAAVSSIKSVRHELQQLGDADIEASLVHVCKPRDEPSSPVDADPYDTVSTGTPTSTGLRFRILRPHAKGGLGEVFVAKDEELHREVALKEIQSRHADDAESRARFLLEAEITGGLEHPGIVPVYGLGQYADGRPFYAMRFIRGDSLKDAIKRFHSGEPSPVRGRLEGERTLELRNLLGRFIDVCQALQYAHDRGVLHRDLKPGNIMLGKYGETLVVDWGLAKPGIRPNEPGTDAPGGADEPTLRPTSASGSAETVAGTAIGTPAYMSPEQAAGRLEQLGPASDVYSLGATLFCLLTGAAPFHSKTAGEILQQVQRGDFPRPRQLKPSTPAPLEAICLRAMAMKRDERYAGPRALADDLEHWLADEPVSAWPEPVTVKLGRWTRRHKPLVSGLAAALLVGLLAGAAGLLWHQDEQNRRSNEQLVRAAETERKRLLAAETIRNALDQAEKPRRDLHAILAKPDGVFGLLNEPARWEAFIQTARNSLKAAQDMLASAEAGAEPGLAERAVKLQEMLDRDEADRVLAEKLEKIRLDRSTIVDNQFDFRRAAERYPDAFAKANLGMLHDPSAAVAAHVVAAPIKEQLLAALDDWAYLSFVLGKQGLAEKLLKIGRLAAPDPTWGDRLRRIELWRDQRALTKLAKEAPAAGLSAPQLELIGRLLGDDNPATIPWLRQAQAQYPADFWLNFNFGIGLNKSDPAEAAGFFRVALGIRPKSSAAYHNLGVALSDQKKLPEAIAAHHKAIAIDPKYANAYCGLGNALQKQKKLSEAIAAYHKAIAIDPKFAKAYNNLGVALQEQKNLPEAIATFHKAIAIDPKEANAYHNLGIAFSEQKKLPEAIAVFHKAIELEPKDANAYYNLGRALYRQKKLPEAIAAYHKAIAIAPNYPEAHCNLGHTLKAQADFAGALKAMAKGHDLGSRRPGWTYPSAVWVKHCATLLALDKKLPGVLQSEPASPTERLALADLCVRYKKHYRDGVGLLETVFREQPTLAEDLAMQHRYNAACAAALAAAGRGVDNVTAKEKAPLRRQARDWLQADLDVYAKQVNDGKAASLLQAELRLAHWLTDPDLAGVREAKALAALPEGEQAAWTKLWGEVARLRQQIRGLITETTFQGTLTDKVLQQVHVMKLETDKTYVIDMKSKELDSYLKLHDPTAKLVAWNDDIAPDNRDARILFMPKETGVYRITATSFQEAGRGGYQLIVRQFGAKPK